MPVTTFEYAIVRVVPDVERGETINVGVIVYSPQADHLSCAIELPRACVATLDPAANLDVFERHLQAIRWICAADTRGGPIAAMPLRERFHWLVHPRSAALQMSAVHAGSSDDLDATRARLFERLASRA